MPTSDASSKTDRLQRLQLFFWNNQGKRYRTSELAGFLGTSVDTVTHDLRELSVSGHLPLTKEGWYWYLPPGTEFQLLPLTLTLPEAASLFLAGRLLTMTQNNRNQHVMSALTKLVAIMPSTLAHASILRRSVRASSPMKPALMAPKPNKALALG